MANTWWQNRLARWLPRGRDEVDTEANKVRWWLTRRGHVTVWMTALGLQGSLELRVTVEATEGKNREMRVR